MSIGRWARTVVFSPLIVGVNLQFLGRPKHEAPAKAPRRFCSKPGIRDRRVTRIIDQSLIRKPASIRAILAREPQSEDVLDQRKVDSAAGHIFESALALKGRFNPNLASIPGDSPGLRLVINTAPPPGCGRR